MKKEYTLMSLLALATLLASLLLIRWLAPQLLGLPPDMVLVRASQEVPPFYENAFREEAPYDGYSIHDPYTRLRSTPFYPDTIDMGPNDLLGFRNLSIPAIADVIIIGDSQTYGNNALLAENWPSQAREMITGKKPVFYSMATGGWSAVQYLNMVKYARLFQPRVVVVAYYSGNDPLESFNMAYGIREFAALIPDAKLKAADAPSVPFPEPEQEQWAATFKGGLATVFTPNVRFASNNPNIPAAMAGWSIMRETAALIAKRCAELGIKPVFTIIPTKEWVYAERVTREGLPAPEKYRKLVAAEDTNINRLKSSIEKLRGAVYVDMAAALRQAAMTDIPLYPGNQNGHPVSAGYRVMAQAIAPFIEQALPASTALGPVAIKVDDNTIHAYLVTGDGAWLLPNLDTLVNNGWKPERLPVISKRDLAAMPTKGILTQIAPDRFGPEAVLGK